MGKGSQYNILNTATATNRRVELLSCTLSVISGVRVQANSKLQRPNQVTIIHFFSLASAPRFPLLCVFSFLRSAVTKQESLWRLDDLRPRHVFPIELQLHTSCLAPSLYRICPLVIQYTRENTQVSQALLIGSPPQLIDGTAGRRLVISYHCFQLSFLILLFPSTDISAALKGSHPLSLLFRSLYNYIPFFHKSFAINHPRDGPFRTSLLTLSPLSATTPTSSPHLHQQTATKATNKA